MPDTRVGPVRTRSGVWMFATLLAMSCALGSRVRAQDPPTREEVLRRVSYLLRGQYCAVKVDPETRKLRALDPLVDAIPAGMDAGELVMEVLRSPTASTAREVDETRSNAVSWLGYRGDTRAKDLILELGEAGLKNSETRRSFAFGLATLCGEEGIARVERLLGDPDRHARRDAVGALVTCGERFLDTFRRIAREDPDPSVRMAAEAGLREEYREKVLGMLPPNLQPPAKTPGPATAAAPQSVPHWDPWASDPARRSPPSPGNAGGTPGAAPAHSDPTPAAAPLALDQDRTPSPPLRWASFAALSAALLTLLAWSWRRIHPHGRR